MCNISDFEDKIINISDFEIDSDYLFDTAKNVKYNSILVSYYKKLIDETSGLNLSSIVPKSKTYDLENCNKYWLFDKYEDNHIKDFVGTYTCKDKFCNNCKKLKQAVRMSRYIPFIENYKNDLYHIVFTIPNVNGFNLDYSLVKMSDTFRKLMRIIRGNYRCFLDFSKYKYVGCIRSLEITFNNDNYHPHFHCAFVFGSLSLEKYNCNSFSYSNRSREVRLFSDFEIILQKLWYMLYNDISITKENFDSLDIGYSVIVDKFRDDDYVELFKYMTKATNENDELLSYDNFKILYFATYRMKQIQGYGCFYLIKDEDITKEEVEEVYDSIKLFLDSDEDFVSDFSKPEDLIYDVDYLIISRRKIYQWLKNIKNISIDDNQL